MIINGGFVCLWDLIFPVDPIDFLAVFKQGAGLLKMKADIVFYALCHRFQNPGRLIKKRSGRLVTKKNRRSERTRIISHASLRQGSAAG